MDKHDFLRELQSIDEDVQRRGVPPVALSEKEVSDIDECVNEHINTLYPDDPIPPAKTHDVIADDNLYHAPANDEKFGFSVKYAVAAVVSVFLIGALFMVSSLKMLPTTHGIPMSITNAELQQHAHLPVGNMIAITGTELSDRRAAYLAGYTKASLVVIGNTDPVKKQNFAFWFLGGDDSELNILDKFDKHSDRYLAHEKTAFWYRQGLATELVQLSAKGAMSDLDTDALHDAMRFYRTSSESIPDHMETTDQRYFDKHNELLDASVPSTHGELQTIVDLTQALKVLIR